MFLRAAFNTEVFAIVEQIPAGRLLTYGQVARLAGYPAHARQVGQALAKAPAKLPCHRVVNSAGGTAPGWTTQRERLEEEGITFRPNGCVDLRRHGWQEAIISSSRAF